MSKTILLTNDDGYHSPGIAALQAELAQRHQVWVVAPDREKSAVSMALTLNQPLRILPIADRVYAVNGTTSDCVNIALQKLMPGKPDFVVSGMNLGENLSEDVFFSGTVGGAFAAHLYGLPALAVSLIAGSGESAGLGFDFAEGARVAARIAERLMDSRENGVIYNLNIPTPHCGEVEVTTLGRKRYVPDIIERCDPRGRSYYWIGTGAPCYDAAAGTDMRAVQNGRISLSVMKYDLNSSNDQERLAACFAGFRP